MSECGRLGGGSARGVGSTGDECELEAGATHQTSIEGSAEVVMRPRRLSEKAGEPTDARVAQALQPSLILLLR